MRFRQSEMKHFPGEHAPGPTWTVLAFLALGPPNLKHLPTALIKAVYQRATGNECLPKTMHPFYMFVSGYSQTKGYIDKRCFCILFWRVFT